MDMMECLSGYSYRIELQADRIPGAIEEAFTDSCKHM